MGYSVGGNTIPLVQDNSISALDAVNKAYDSMNSGMEKLANIPFIGRKMVQDNADARYSAALNKFSNDPEGLARALANGDISTTDVTADTLNKTQNRLSDIGQNYSRAYLQNQAEELNNYLAGQGGKDLRTAAGLSQQGKDISALRNANYVPAGALPYWLELNPQAQRNIDTGNNIAARGLAFSEQQYANRMKATAAAMQFYRMLHSYGNVEEPNQRQALIQDLYMGKYRKGINAPVEDISYLFEDMQKDPEVLTRVFGTGGMPEAIKQNGVGNPTAYSHLNY